jgi:hypothetical protein
MVAKNIDFISVSENKETSSCEHGDELALLFIAQLSS